jgi:acyl transferase domain-containing protein/acyl carrier protein
LYYDPRPAIPGKMNTRWGGFLDEIENFDAEFFGIAPYEAAEIDPQQRLLLEVAWRAFEDSGLPIERLSGQETGVFIGISTNDYLHLQIKQSPGMERYNAYSGLGNANSISANRLSYIFNLRGPSLAVDTACSSSLTALHLAVQSLRRHECTTAVAGGVNLILSPGTTVTLSQFSMMAPDGRCKVFDQSADGYVRSEGSGLVVLKRRSDAIRDGDKILAYIRGSALGQDGRSLGITAPNPAAQRHVIEKALADAGCRPEEITLLEAHGTGTAAGDPVEIEQLKQLYGGASSSGRCYLGSVKASVGHLEAAAGVASVIKLILALQRKEIPPQIHLNELNPRISLEGSRLLIPLRPTGWQPATGRRLAAVSSFGFGGANAHAILEEAEAEACIADSSDTTESILLPLSAKNEVALREQARAWIDFLSQPATASLASIGYSQSVRRSHFGLRAAFVAASREELARKLQTFIEKEPSTGDASEQIGSTRCAFLFSGQGSQVAGMGSALYERFPAFRAAFDHCASVFESEEGALSLQSLVFSQDGTELGKTLYQQPALFALEYALGKLMLSLGVQPTALLGHSLGEYAAACIADCFDPEEGMRLVIARARLMASIKRAGAMLAVAAGEATLRPLIQSSNFEYLSVAAVNSSQDIVLSGPVEEIERVSQLLEEMNIAARRLRTSQAFHSPLMDEILDEFEQVAATINFRAPRIPLISNLTGDQMLAPPDALYWRQHLRECVRFEDGFGCLQERGIRSFLEIGPGRTLLVLARRNASAADLKLLPTCIDDEVDSFLHAIGQLYIDGAQLQWTELYRNQNVSYVNTLPGHPFQRKRHWFADDRANGSASLQPAKGNTPATTSLASFPPSKWGYHLRWIESDAPDISHRLQAEDDVHWIIVGDGEGLAKELVRALPQPKRQIFRISYDEARPMRGFRRVTDRETGTQRFFVAPGCDAETYAEALGEILNRLSRADASRWNVIYLNGMACAPAGQTTVSSLERDERLHGVGDLASFAQALIRTALAMRVWIITTNAQPVHIEGQSVCEDHLNLAQSTIWGFGHTLFLEHPEMRGGQTDLDTFEDANAQAAQVLRQIAATDGESLAAFRARKRYVPRLLSATVKPPDEPISFRSDGAYLVTGGLGGLGLKCAQWLIERGAGRIVLLSRRSLPARSTWGTLPPDSEEQQYIAGIRAIEATGASVEVVAADVTDYGRVSEIIREINSSEYRLRGVLHAAGVNWFGKIAELDRERLLETLKIKVAAAWHLYEETRDCELDMFLLFSSVSALWGSVDLSHYTAANQFLDSLAYQCRREGRHALSINWGPWSAVGMSARTKEMRLLTKLGFRLIMPRMALSALEAVMRADETRLMIADMDWRQFQAFINFSACPLLFERVEGASHIASAFAHKPSQEISRIREASPEEARSYLIGLVRGHLSSVLLLDAGQTINIHQRFNLMGMDSLMAIAFALRLESIAGTKLPTTLAYNYPTIADVADHLFELIRGESQSVVTEQEMAAINPIVPAASTDKRLWFYTEPNGWLKLRFFCLPYAGAGASIYQRWQESLASAAEVIPVQLPGREERSNEQPVREMAEMVRRLADALLSLPPAPFAVFGHSLGALISFELVRELRRRNAPLPERLILSGCGAPNGKRSLPQINGLPDEEFKRHLVNHFDTPRELIEDEIIWQAVMLTLRSDIALLETYRAEEEEPLDVPFSIFGSAEDKLATRESLLAWSKQTSVDFSLKLFRGGHLFLKSNQMEVLEAIRRELSSAMEEEIPA